MTKTDDLIRAILTDAGPVRPLRSPFVRAAAWLAVAIAVVIVVALSFGLRTDLPTKLTERAFLLELAAAALTGSMAAVAAFCVSLPDRSGLWLLLPVPAAILWLLTIGYGCLTNWVTLGPDGLAVGTTLRCLATAVLTSVPLAGTLVAMVRHAGPIRPRATATMGALAVGALTAGGLRLFHDLDATVLVLAWSFGMTGILVALGWTGGKTVFSMAARRPPRAQPLR
jgi:hypothetical protein